ncbi:hypothetical protein AD940_03180 [Gluconobacter thailandicus]|uniref:LysR substrate-binding domain-containing protein n=1 Tax=Gluconobacter thailandicus TaxID=257438 RepID=UPI000796A9C9|nr:LysR substrate-binding domain-containing protein [Gluconobacter thailandicus]KXV35391.1 hypothetical protein AD940_03180 [Gluconobacter thailandicus]
MSLPSTSVLGALRCFHVAATKLSFTNAATELCVTQGAISQQIRFLERYLGLSLFVRSSRGITLTSEGEILQKVMLRVFSETQSVLDKLQAHSTPLQISCSPSFALHWLAPRLSGFSVLHPNIPVRLVAEFQDLNCEELSRGRIDIAIRYDPKKYEDVTAEDLLDEFIIPVSTASFIDEKAQLELCDLHLLHDSEPWVGAPRYCEWGDWIEENCPHYNREINGPEFNLSSLALGAALKNQGIAMGRAALVYDDILSGRFVVPLGGVTRSRSRYVLISRDTVDKRTLIFTNWLKLECLRFRQQRDELLETYSK